ncbi:FAD-dependent monooxygenase [Methylocella sp.]|uniref:FAD-dependent monooxygenase n=1 Tax=Methylocella sp. TaxID=1978226 RepID=UPI0037844E11
MSAPRAVIVGAGIGGLCAALRLAQEGWRVSVFEKAQALAEVGAGLQLSPNATCVLDRLGALDALRDAALEPEATRLLRARDGATLALMPLADARARWGGPYLFAHRADLQRALLAAAAKVEAISLGLGVEATGFSQTNENVATHFRKGASRFSVEGDVLVAADGSRSILRRALFGAPAQALAMSRRSAWRTLVPAARAPEMALRPEAALWLGPGAHLVHYPLRGRSFVNIVAVVAEAARPDVGPFWANEADPRDLAPHFARFDARARALVAAAPSWRKWRLHDRAPLTRWVGGRVALLGDAAHPMLPFLAQGAAQAIEDADALGAAIASIPEPQAALRAYEAARLARASRVQQASRAQERVCHLAGAPAAARDVAMRLMGGARLLERYAWIYAGAGLTASSAP